MQWKEIRDYEGLYEINSNGKIRSVPRNGTKGGILKYCVNKDGYYTVSLCKNKKRKTYSVHRLVALHFLPNNDDTMQVNHINENKLDNRVCNLEWVTTKENINHGTRTKRQVETRNKKLYTQKVVCIDKKTMQIVREFDNIPQASEQMGICRECIKRCLDGKRKSTRNHIWKYK